MTMKTQQFFVFAVTIVSPALGLQATTTVRELPFLGATEKSKHRTNFSMKRYYDGQGGACGCETSSGAFLWQVCPINPHRSLSYISLQLGISSGVYTAAASQAIYDSAGRVGVDLAVASATSLHPLVKR